ncbi:hypothetical protein ACK3SF_04655 [Candidatus Nanosalina sp. VS9-1]|uniref:hypothetical protein n=1 Tax=Candidatus Nanosalina sp. VS9-1 TaxID=3388566 RepID=UPI0039E0218F
MPEMTVERPDTDELFEWVVENSYAHDEAEIALDVTGQGRVVEASSVERLMPRLDNLQIAGVFRDGGQLDGGVLDSRKNTVSASKGERHAEFYREFFGADSDNVDFFSAPLKLANLDACLEEVRDVDQGLRTHPEFRSENVRMDTGFENRYIESDELLQAYSDFEDQLGFQIFFTYTGDPEASEQYREFQSENTLNPVDVDGVTGVVCIGRDEETVVYTAGPKDLEVEMPRFPGYSQDAPEVKGLENLV